jgi:hypothetical protein
MEDGRVDGVRVRIDMRAIDSAFLAGVVHLAQYCECLLYTPEGRLLEPDVAALAREAAQSSASKFVADPRGFLDELSRRTQERTP